jgi:methylglutaconyl-CoA hydratase
MPNPIADPLVENVISDDLAGRVRLEATPEGVAVVTIDRAEAGNALDGQTVEALAQVFETLHGADHLRLVFLRGEGGTFSIGEDPAWTTASLDWDEGAAREDAAAAGLMLKALADVPALTVALVEGDAMGLGAGLVAACDVAVAVRGARIGFPEVQQGLLPAVAAPFVIDAVGPRAAKALLATGRTLDADAARALGLVQVVVDDVQALAAEQECLAEEAVQGEPEAVRLVKALVQDVEDRRIDRDLVEDLARQAGRRKVSDEAREAVAARAEGRPPAWRA